MSEVVNSIQLALADQNVYDEVLCYTCDNIKSCYVDKASPLDSNRVETKNYGSTAGTYENGDHFIYNDNERLADESGYIFAGLMRGVTITFEPERSSNKTAFVLYNGYINAAGHATGDGLNYLYGSCPETEKTSADMVTNGYTENMMLLGNMHSFGAPTHNYLYNRIRATVGDRIELTSQTYRNSCYTVFIRMGTTGGNQADKQDAIMVYGQWSGTNLSVADRGQGAGVNGNNAESETPKYLYLETIIPEEGSYTYTYLGCDSAKIYKMSYEKLDGLENATEEEKLEYWSDYMYGCSWTDAQANGYTEADIYEEIEAEYEDEKAYGAFANGWEVAVKNKDQTIYEDIPTHFDNLPIVSLYCTFMDCSALETAPKIPASVTDMLSAFSGCKSLKTAPIIPVGVTDMSSTFHDCTSLQTAPDLSHCTNLTDMAGAFFNCTNLTEAPAIPASVTDMSSTFSGCTSLQTAPDLSHCTNLTDMYGTFFNCTNLTEASVIPASVTNMCNTFYRCTKLTGEIVINTTHITTTKNVGTDGFGTNSCYYCFYGVNMSKITLTGAPKEVLNTIGQTGNYWTPIT